ncbi:energy transducer TonB [Hymenobacter bucti]|uniref:Energy transducer TonB n=1 Tax=Hymenobacter bucti TaxID=1844114 RepID=A0ABW4QRR3_9BACT
MKAYLFFLSRLLAGCATVKDNAALQALADQDQYDRTHNVAAMGSHDAAHQQTLRQLIATGQLRTGTDYLNAAIVLQHADSAQHYLLANKFAKKAVVLSPQNKEAKILVAQSWDRYQRSLGQPQWYGLQHHVINGQEYLQPIDTARVTDAERAALFVSTLPQKLAYFNKLYGKHETSVQKYVLTDAQLNALQEAQPRAELVGTYEDLFHQAKYPAVAAAKHIRGFVLVEATIDAQGHVSRADVVEGLGYGCDEEATRLLKSARYINPTGAPHDVRVQVPFGQPAPRG